MLQKCRQQLKNTIETPPTIATNYYGAYWLAEQNAKNIAQSIVQGISELGSTQDIALCTPSTSAMPIARPASSLEAAPPHGVLEPEIEAQLLQQRLNIIEKQLELIDRADAEIMRVAKIQQQKKIEALEESLKRKEKEYRELQKRGCSPLPPQVPPRNALQRKSETPPPTTTTISIRSRRCNSSYRRRQSAVATACDVYPIELIEPISDDDEPESSKTANRAKKKRALSFNDIPVEEISDSEVDGMETWENLRKKARSFENSIDVKLVSLNKLTANSHGGFDIDEKTVSSRQALFRTLTAEIEGLIEQLSATNDEMNKVVNAESSASWSNNPAIQHTLRRHYEILRDYGSEFRRARDNVEQVLQREMLLSSTNDTKNEGRLNNRARGYDMYLKENDHISSCERLLDEQLDMAMSTKENVARQGINLRGISSRLQQVTKKYPAINNLMQRIKTKKQKNTIILSAVISFCLIFTIYWIIS
ncbi:unnamed protein product [Caenorhabditis bovis]|uniref:Golgi SNAP receptor complex member 1 n=1 Tax=Caenorhabditis bovis TaxID=2654633 RepID=A0A8S1ELS6_9PELO|nr:unnamed protein product [Caenorhabditis bovis]